VRPSLRSLVLVAAVPVVLGVAAISGVPNAVASPGQQCGKVGFPYAPHHRVRVVVIRGVDCPTARRIAWWFGHPLKSGGERGPGGWECFNGHLPSRVMFSCARGRARGNVWGWYHAFKTFAAR
jgi:hypothetical protein